MGFCTALGGPTAHTAILARSMGIPAVVGLGEALLAQVRTGMTVAIDGAAGALILDPDAETMAVFEKQRQADLAARTAAFAGAQAEARTADGKHVEVVANLATAAEAEVALQAGAEGVGLLRTEFIFQERTEPPSEEEQYEIYRQVAQAMAGRPVVIRTLDIGGDKPAPYLQLPVEANPFLGWRAIRISLAMPAFFKVQLRAILRAAAHGQVLVMFPMIATVEEVVQAQALLAEAASELASLGIPHAASIPAGIMVEVPSAAMIADQLAPLVDFFSIGTNDLTQYTFAVDRGNARVASVGDPLHPAVLRQVARVIDAAHATGKWVGLCGELAGRPEGIPILLGLGLDEFSMSAASIPAAKALLARLNVSDAQQLAQRVLNLPDAAAVKAEVKRFVERLAVQG
jgi:phosphoenolpyruvate-protein phosphotransferase